MENYHLNNSNNRRPDSPRAERPGRVGVPQSPRRPAGPAPNQASFSSSRNRAGVRPKRPVPNAEAARRAARVSMDREAESVGQEPVNYSAYEYENPLESYYTAGIDNDYIDDLMDESYEAEPKLPRPAKIALIVGGALLILLIIFLIIRAVMKPGSSEVRLERRTKEKRGVIETTEEVTTEKINTAESEEDVTLPPVGTDPYQNAPVWTPPTEEPTLEVTISSVAPPPVVNMPTEAPVDPTIPSITEPQTAEAPYVENPVIDNNVVEDPTIGDSNEDFFPEDNAELANSTNGGNVENPSPAELVSNTPQGEDAIVQLPPASDYSVMDLPPPTSGRTISGGNSAFFMRPNINGQYELAKIEGDYSELYGSADNSHIVRKSNDGKFYLHSAGYDPQELPIGAAIGLDKMVGNQGLAYISGGILYYMPYNTLQTVVVSPDSSSALMAEQAGQFLVVAEEAVRIMQADGSVVKELLPQYSSMGTIRLTEYSQDGQVAIFQDDLTTYLYLPRIYGDEVLRLEKAVPATDAKIMSNNNGSEFLIKENGVQSLTRVRSNGAVEKIIHPDWVLDDNSYVLSVPDGSGSSYGTLVIYSNDRLYLSNASSYYEQGGNSYYQASLLYSGIAEYITSGYGVYWTDYEGNLFAIDSRTDVNSDAFAVNKIGSAGIKQLSSNIDGSAIYYVKDSTLWERRRGQAATALAKNVSDYISNPEGSKFYIITNGGGLKSYAGGLVIDIAEDGSGISRASLDSNPMTSAGGNTWIATSRITYLVGNEILRE